VAPLPILSFLIEHPEGRFLVDTGDTAENSTPG
jgi:N-acyl homoserine lactone hydrolase